MGKGGIRIKDAFIGTIGSQRKVYEVGDVSYSMDESTWRNYTRRSLENKMILWINKVCSSKNYVVRNVTADLMDGVVFGWFVSLLFDQDATLDQNAPRMPIQPLTSSLHVNRMNWSNILDYLTLNNHLGAEPVAWSDIGLSCGNTAEIYYLLVALIHQIGEDWELPSHFSMSIIKTEYLLHKQTKVTVLEYPITLDETEFNLKNKTSQLSLSQPALDTSVEDIDCPEDTIDLLFKPENTTKLAQVEAHMLTFANKHLAKLDVQLDAFYEELASGEPIILLLSVLTDFWVPIASYVSGPESIEDCIANIRVAFKILDALEIQRQGIKAPAIAAGDKRLTLKLIYKIFAIFKTA